MRGGDASEIRTPARIEGLETPARVRDAQAGRRASPPSKKSRARRWTYRLSHSSPQELALMVQSGWRVIALETFEEERATKLLERVAEACKRTLVRWSSASGLGDTGQGRVARRGPEGDRRADRARRSSRSSTPPHLGSAGRAPAARPAAARSPSASRPSCCRADHRRCRSSSARGRDAWSSRFRTRQELAPCSGSPAARRRTPIAGCSTRRFAAALGLTGAEAVRVLRKACARPPAGSTTRPWRVERSCARSAKRCGARPP